jgi:hypothetical protein
MRSSIWAIELPNGIGMGIAADEAKVKRHTASADGIAACARRHRARD